MAYKSTIQDLAADAIHALNDALEKLEHEDSCPGVLLDELLEKYGVKF